MENEAATPVVEEKKLSHNEFIDLTPNEPLFLSTTPGNYKTWRYSHWIIFKENLYIYFEAANKNSTNEIRLSKLPLRN